MKAPYIVLFCCIATAALAQPAPQMPPPAMQAANEALILEQLSARRDWQAKEIAVQDWAQALSKQNDELRAQLAEANKAKDAGRAEITELKGRLDGLQKAQPPPVAKKGPGN